MSDDLQRTAEWYAERAGKWTGSKFVDVLARNKKTGEPLKCYFDLIWQVVSERMTEQPTEGASGFALQWGTDVEPFAKEAYELETGDIVADAGFITHPQYAFAGASPDGLIGVDGGVEFKCPKSSVVHLERFISGVPEEYVPQIHGCMWVTGRQWWDFVSYDPRQKDPNFRMLIIRVKRDEDYIANLEKCVLEAEAAAQELQERLRKIAA